MVKSFVAKNSKQCLNICAGIVCGFTQAVGIEIFTKNSLNEALSLKSASDACKDELPIQLATEHDKVAQIMEEGGKTAVLKAKAIMKSTGVNQKLQD
jgi:hypothetical protein